MLRALEVPWQRFYTKDIAAALRDLDLWRLFTELLADQAIVVAKALPATARLADQLTKQRGRVFEFLRRGELNATEVEIRYRDAIDTLCPDGSADLRAVLSALHKRDLSKCALDWLSGGNVEEADLDRLGAAKAMDVQIDAVPTLGALAQACRLLNRVFILCVDELERFTDWHPSGMVGSPAMRDRTNIEWLRKLAEAVAGAGGVFVVAGQDRAWENQPVDVIDRLTFHRIINLTS